VGKHSGSDEIRCHSYRSSLQFLIFISFVILILLKSFFLRIFELSKNSNHCQSYRALKLNAHYPIHNCTKTLTSPDKIHSNTPIPPSNPHFVSFNVLTLLKIFSPALFQSKKSNQNQSYGIWKCDVQIANLQISTNTVIATCDFGAQMHVQRCTFPSWHHSNYWVLTIIHFNVLPSNFLRS
jgi:hypothetical protein